nr:1,4-beta-xylanase [uncultured Cohaesibacter sp.]
MNSSKQEQWSKELATTWWQNRDWICGFNYLPSSSVNFLEMWMAETFDEATIIRELGWANAIGFNSVRVNLHSLIWQHDRSGLVARFDRFLTIARSCGLSVMPVLFDDCGFGGAEPVYGPQPSPLPGIHNSRAVASPGRATVMDRSKWPVLEHYVKDLVASFAEDPRILMWDLYNEPGNRMIFTPDGSFGEYDAALSEYSADLMAQSFEWARSAAPSQPLTVGAWQTPPAEELSPAYDNDIDRTALELSDIITFHAYCDLNHLKRYLDDLAPYERPLICTEWMARGVGSRFGELLPFYRDQKIGCYNWGFVKGRTQTHLPWPGQLTSFHGAASEKEARMEWFHDVLNEDGTPYDPTETDLISRMTDGLHRGKDMPHV